MPFLGFTGVSVNFTGISLDIFIYFVIYGLKVHSSECLYSVLFDLREEERLQSLWKTSDLREIEARVFLEGDIELFVSFRPYYLLFQFVLRILKCFYIQICSPFLTKNCPCSLYTPAWVQFLFYSLFSISIAVFLSPDIIIKMLSRFSDIILFYYLVRVKMSSIS